MSNDLPTDEELTALDIDLSQFYGLQPGTFLRTLAVARDIERERRGSNRLCAKENPPLFHHSRERRKSHTLEKHTP